MKKIIILLVAVLLVTLIYLATPVYQGLAHRNMVPMVGFSYLSLPDEQPANQQIFHDDFINVGNEALTALKKQQQLISAPGYTASVAIEGNIIWSAAVGWSDIESRTPITTNTILRIGSTSKALTSAGLAQLVMHKSLDLDTPLKQLLQPLPNQLWGNMTPRQLASHMAGLPHYGDNTELGGILDTLSSQTHYSDVMDSLAIFDESELLFETGEEFSYSSFGTVLLSAAMQAKAEMSYQEHMQQTVIQPLKMENTGTPESLNSIQNIASFYWRDHSTPHEFMVWYDIDLSHRLAGGGWLSTSEDLVKLGQGFLDENYISSEVRESFWTPQKLNNGEVNPENYGIGWRIHDFDLGEPLEPVKVMHHGGVTAGAQSFLIVIPQYRLSLAVNANIRTAEFSDFASIAKDIARLFILELISKEEK